jgi:hypothetical protein
MDQFSGDKSPRVRAKNYDNNRRVKNKVKKCKN